MPSEVQAATEKYKSEQDVVGRFVEDCCITFVGSALRVRADKLYTAFREWAEREGEYVLSQRKFGGQLTTKGFERFKSSVSWYRSIDLREATGSGSSEPASEATEPNEFRFD